MTRSRSDERLTNGTTRTVERPAAEVPTDRPVRPKLYALENQVTRPGRTAAATVRVHGVAAGRYDLAVVAGPTGVKLTDGGVVEWRPGWDDIGTHPITVRVTDVEGAATQATFQVNVENSPPQLEPIPDQTAHPGHSVLVQAVAWDPDAADELVYSLVKGPAGSQVDGVTGEFTWEPGWNNLGSELVTIRVTDPAGASDQVSFVVSVENEPPYLAPLLDQEAEVAEPVEFVATGFDADGDELTYALVQGPEGAVVDSGQGGFHWVPTATDVGTHIVTVRVSDPSGAGSQRSCLIVVQAT